MDRDKLPAGWERIQLGEICLPVTKVRPSEEPDTAFDYVDISSVDRTTLTIATPQRLRGSEAPSRARQKIQVGDILISTVRPNLRTLARVPIELDGQIASTGFCVLRPSPEVAPGFVFWAVLTEDFQKRVLKKARGVSYPAVRDPDILEEQIVLPPKEEQDRIVKRIEDLMGTVEEGMTSVADAAADLSLLRVAALHVLAGKGQPRARLDEVGEVFVGATPKRSEPRFWNGDVPWVSSSEVALGRIGETRESITTIAAGDLEKRVHPPGTVLLAMYGEGKTRGQAAILDIAAATNQAVAAIRVDEAQALSEFVFYCLVARYAQTREIGQGGQQINLNKKLVKAIDIPCPPLNEQRPAVAKIKRTLGGIKRLDDALAGQSEIGKALKGSILRHAFSGELSTREATDEPASEMLARIQGEKALPARAGSMVDRRGSRRLGARA